jgi:ABC-type transport system involved in multi-copper enzyme maturation permease subunit
MNPYRYELLHLLRRKAVIAVIIVAALAGAFNYYTIELAAPGEMITAAGYAYVGGGAYHVELWAYDVAGDPVPGVRASLVVNTDSSPPSIDYEGSATSDAQGQLSFVLPIPSPPEGAGLSVNVTSSDPALPLAGFAGALNGEFGLGNGSGPAPSPNALPQVIDGPITVVTENFYSTLGRNLVVWAEPGGRAPTGDRVLTCEVLSTNVSPYYGPSNQSPANFSRVSGWVGSTCANSTDEVDLGPLTGPRTILPDVMPSGLTVPPGESAYLLTEIVNASGGVEYSTGPLYPVYPCPGVCVNPGGFGSPDVPLGPSSSGPSLLQSFSTDLELFVPLMALVLAYWSYARPRLSGMLEPVLARPLTRRGLFLTRYAALAIALGSAALGEVLLLDAGLSAILGEPLPAEFLAPLVGGILVAALGFAGLILLSAHAFRSTGPVLGIGIALLIVFSLFWPVIVAITGSAGGLDLDSSAFLAYSLRAGLAAPPQFPAMVTGILSGTSNGFSVTYASAGVTAPVLALAGAMWVLLPFLLTYWRVVTRD